MADERDGGFLEGLLLGALLGGLLGMLFAPQSGQETRAWIKRIKDENQDVIDDAVQSSEELIKTTKDSIEEGFRTVTQMIDKKLKK
jgi:gas vesicle protein